MRCLFFLLGALALMVYLLMAWLSWLVAAYLDGAFMGEGDGFNRQQRWQRIGEALLWPWWALLTLGETCQQWVLAAMRR